MKNLRTKGMLPIPPSRFFKEGPNQDERAANAEGAGAEVEFDAGIQSVSLRRKAPRFFMRRTGNMGKSRPAPLSLTAGGEQRDQRQEELPPAKPHRPIFSPFPSTRDPRPSPGSTQTRITSISRPTLTPQLCSPPTTQSLTIVPFHKPAGLPPPRPPRPDSLDEDTLAFMRSNARTGFSTNNRVSNSTATCSTPRSYTSSIEGRLGLPTGYATPHSYSTESSPLAARFPLDASHLLSMRDSAGSVKANPRFSAYLNAQQGVASDGVEAEDREVGPLELYDKGKEGEWIMEKRVSQGPKGVPGMLFRDRRGGWHFVADI
ncbi:hypothetical protein P153DRAFT_423769 [Dothidotthia symphoricarpi CBS 119687]|uniref:Uncharacterized protein n=1 Tax=Dothidotthia symphoricarpi CBS 119687 TaxID=1392245 RepID=A0A6A6AC49_9PLEO|nr:uncharacterized protein P153DRAFT_423769 [Dothidotthia symphoricarpi CBS 119687]KAF2128584.1 hypothetical protein P153DRAFT_423769 [Dothidotthia symphoricarpi CBS 119687]